MAELCCRVRRCGHVSLGRSRAVSRRAKDVAVNAVGIVTAEGAGGTGGVDAMNSAGVGDAMVSGTARREVRRVRSIGRSRAGSIRRRLCFRR